MAQQHSRSRGSERGRHARHWPLALTTTTACVAIVASGMVFATPALAQQAAAASPEATPTTAAPVDVVRLRNGGSSRGTVVDFVPEDYVVIQLPTGETRRFEMADVVCSGPIASDPATAPAADATRRDWRCPSAPASWRSWV